MQTSALDPAISETLAARAGARHKLAGLVICSLAAVLLIAAATTGGSPAKASRPPVVSAGNPGVGVFAGIDASGLPIYRLPPVYVSADRRTALDRIAQDEELERPNSTHKPAMTPDRMGAVAASREIECVDCTRLASR